MGKVLISYFIGDERFSTEVQRDPVTGKFAVVDLKDGKRDGQPMTLGEYLELHEEHRQEVEEAIRELSRQFVRE